MLCLRRHDLGARFARHLAVRIAGQTCCAGKRTCVVGWPVVPYFHALSQSFALAASFGSLSFVEHGEADIGDQRSYIVDSRTRAAPLVQLLKASVF